MARGRSFQSVNVPTRATDFAGAAGRWRKVTSYWPFASRFEVGMPRVRSWSARAKLRYPTCISSRVCSPKVTARLGSGLFGFSAELSKWASVWRIVPSGIGLGWSRT